MPDDPDTDPEALLDQARDQRRTTTEPTATAAGDTPTLPDAVAEAFADLERGALNATFGFRDERLVALLVGLERSGQLATVVADARVALGRETDADPDAATRSEAARLLLRLGLQSLDADLLDAGSAGYKKHLQEQADEF